MLTRRNLRIKAFQALFAGRSRGETNPQAFVAEYTENLRLFEKMYVQLLLLPVAFNDYLDSEKEFELAKYFPSKDKVREASSFDKNRFVKWVEGSSEIIQLSNKSPFDWRKHGELFVKMFKEIKEQPFFVDYMVFEEPSEEQDKEFIKLFYGFLFELSEDFQEEMSNIYQDWDNDVFAFYRMLKDSIENTNDAKGLFIQQTYKSEEEDYPFVRDLIVKTTTESASYLEILQKVAKSWDTERIARVDIVLMEMAITEFIYFDQIPIKVTINEYLDLAKSFSTAKSHIFINGILDKTKEILAEDGKMVKEGRGLRDH